jgi:hypothetical protein
MIAFFNKLPSWLLSLSTPELVAALAYTLVFALFESFLVFISLTVLAFVLPRTWLGDKFAAHCTVFIMLISFWAAGLQFWIHRLIRSGSVQILALTLVLYLLTLAVGYMLVVRFARIRSFVVDFAERLPPLLYLYLAFSALGLMVVLVRNIL